jgi:hypothetical protein
MSVGKRSLWLVAAWAAATALTAGVAWAVVGLAGESVGEEAVQPLSAEEVAALGVETTVDPPGETTTVPETIPSATTVPETAPTNPEPGTTTTHPTVASTTTTFAPPGGGTTSTTTAPVMNVDSRRITGGTVVVRWTVDWVELVSATPDDGFIVEVKDRGPDGVEIEFEGEDVSSHYSAEVSDGELVVQVEVDDEGGEDEGEG